METTPRGERELRSDLLPLSIGDLFDEAIDLYKRNFALFAGIVAVLYVPTQLLVGLVFDGIAKQTDTMGLSTEQQSRMVFDMLGQMLVVLCIYAFFTVIHCGAITIAASERYLGRRATMGAAYRALLPHLLRLIVTWVIIGVIAFALSVVVLVVFAVVLSILMAAAGVASSADGGSLAVAIGLSVVIGCFIAMIGIFVWLGINATQVVVLEGGGYVTALQRNMALVRGRFMRTVWAFVLLFFISQTLILALQGALILGIELAVYTWVTPSVIVKSVVEVVLGTVVGLFVQPLWMCALTVLYYDLRVRNEGFDISLMIRNMETAPASAPVSAPVSAVEPA